MPVEDHYGEQYGAQALDQQIERDRMDGYAVISGCGVTLDEANGQVTIASGQVLWNGTVVDVAQQTISYGDPGFHPRRSVIYISDNAGTASFEQGDIREAKSALDNPAEVWEYYQPFPPSMDSINSVVLAEVWLDNRGDDFIRDRRLSANYQINNLAAQDVATETFSATEGEVSSTPVDNPDITNKGYVDGETSTVQTNLDDHVADDTNPHTTTLEQARSQNNALSGNVDFGGNAAAGLGQVNGHPSGVVIGAEGDFWPMFSTPLLLDNNATVDTTTWANVNKQVSNLIAAVTDITPQNVQGRYGRICGQVSSLTSGETLTLRIQDSPDTSIDITGTGSFVGPVGAIVPSEGTSLDIEGQVTAGSATVEAIAINVGGQVVTSQ